MKKWLEKVDWIYVIVPLALLGTFWVIAAFTGQWPWQSNPYNSYALQTDSWLKGRLDLGQNYEWLELAIYQGKYFVSFPPFPSYNRVYLCGQTLSRGKCGETVFTVLGAYALLCLRLFVCRNERLCVVYCTEHEFYAQLDGAVLYAAK